MATEKKKPTTKEKAIADKMLAFAQPGMQVGARKKCELSICKLTCKISDAGNCDISCKLK